MKNVVSLEGFSKEMFFLKKRELVEAGATSPPLYTTEDPYISCRIDYIVYVDMREFLAKKRNGDFAVVEYNNGILVGHSKFMFLN